MRADPDFLAQMKQAELALKPGRSSSRIGRHAIAHRGRSLDFAEYRQYLPGDEPRDLDWKLYARTDRYYVKLRDTHAPARVAVVPDLSASMAYRSPAASSSKLRGALMASFGLAYVLHKQGDAFTLAPLHSPLQPAPPRSSAKAFGHVVQRLGEIDRQSDGERRPLPGMSAISGTDKDTDLSQDASAERGLELLKPHGIDHLFFISDFLASEAQWRGWMQALKLCARKATLVQVLDPWERDPDPQVTSVFDLEAPGRVRRLSADDWRLYAARFARHCEDLKRAAAEAGFSLVQWDTGRPDSANFLGMLNHRT